MILLSTIAILGIAIGITLFINLFNNKEKNAGSDKKADF
jgi:hypothetical protein